MIVRTAINLVALYARVSAPVIPFTAEAIALAVGETYPPSWPTADGRTELTRLPVRRAVNVPPVLFRKIEEADVAAWAERFGGVE